MTATDKHGTTLFLSVFIRVFLWLVPLCVPVAAQWPQWRGPGGSGISPEKSVPTQWSEATDKSPAKNIKWKIEIPGRGHSSPVISNGRLYLRDQDLIFCFSVK